MTLRDGMGREVGGGFRMVNTCTPMVDSCQCMAKTTTKCKVISLQLKKKIRFKMLLLDFLGGPVVKTPSSSGGGMGRQV